MLDFCKRFSLNQWYTFWGQVTGLTTVLAFNRPWTDGLITFGESEAVSLLNIFTQPRKNLKALKGYEAKYKGGDSTGYGDGYDNEIFFTLVPGGVGIGMKF